MRERIRRLMESTEMTQQTFAEHIGISPASMSSIFNGRTNPTLNIVEAIKRKFPDISTDWLVFGVGDMYDSAAASAPAAEVSPESNPNEPALPFDSTELETTHHQGALLIQKTPQQKTQVVEMREIAPPAKPARTITEIRVFFDDQTYESFVPRK